MNDDQTTEEYIMRWVNGYCNAMNHLPSTRIMERKSSCTDPAIKVIVKTARGLSESEAEAGEVYHNLFMSAENIQGNLLEEYIASKVWQCTKRRCATTVLNLYPQWRIFRIRPKASSLKVCSKGLSVQMDTTNLNYNQSSRFNVKQINTVPISSKIKFNRHRTFKREALVKYSSVKTVDMPIII